MEKIESDNSFDRVLTIDGKTMTCSCKASGDRIIPDWETEQWLCTFCGARYPV